MRENVNVKLMGGPRDGELTVLPRDQFDYVVSVLCDAQVRLDPPWSRGYLKYRDVRYVYQNRTDEAELGYRTFVLDSERV